MRSQLTAIPEDGLIIVDGEPLFFAYDAPYAVRVVQWKDGSGQLEYADVNQNRALDATAYAHYVAPFAALWEAEKNRRDELATRPPSLEAARAQALAALREQRRAVEYGGFVFEGQRWESEQKDELRLNSMLKMFELSGQKSFPGWKTAEGAYITATPEIIQGAALALMQHYAASFAVEAAKEKEIKTLKSAGEVQAWLEKSLAEGWPGN